LMGPEGGKKIQTEKLKESHCPRLVEASRKDDTTIMAEGSLVLREKKSEWRNQAKNSRGHRGLAPCETGVKKRGVSMVNE